MNYLFSLLAILFLITSCNNDATEMYLSGEIKGLRKGTILLQKIEDTSLVAVDSVTVDGEAIFSFSETIESPEVYVLSLRIKDESLLDKELPFFAEPGEVNIITSLKNFNSGAVITGSKNQAKLSEYKKLKQRYADRNLDLIEQEFKALQSGNDSLLEVIRKRKQSTVTGKYLATVNFAINNNDYELAPYLMLNEVFDANVKYLDTVYKSLTPKIKDSKYGIELESYITERKQAGN
ncbi:DUF4369 domain-containing protein [Altibacter sp.]|uniref:DUF4369 domain-containing protein n=1 Tax=Altibacter sp. TaxID=2024823 RepID=UPI00258D8F94|nr:DUF4369 domain-containing protein [Altibacter sp.]MCW8980191.1 DUF4369 domain-containing protein [Altibacter sp.]MCW9036343.1 DUF4369 domain-containing protein [Altibacter sp.]